MIDLKKTDLFIIYSFAFFNTALCALFGLGLPISPLVLKLTQVALTLYVVVRVLYSGKVESFDISLVILIFIFLLLTFSYKNNSNIKMVFDALVIPLFILFGRSSKVNFVNVVFNTLKIVLVFSSLEIFFPDLYLQILPIGEYYNATRAWVSSQDLDVDSLSYYIGAVRPKESYFTLIDHRLGASFLESLTLGYFLCLALIVSLIKYANNTLSRIQIVITMFSIFLLLLMSDTRTCLFMASVITLIYYFREKFLLISPVYYGVGLFIACWIIYWVLPDSAGDIVYRLSLTFVPLQEQSLLSILGLDTLKGNHNDSGFLYLVSIYGIIPLILTFMLFWKMGATCKAQVFRFYLIVTIITFTFVLFFGAAFLSVKIAALWFATLGSLYEQYRYAK